MTTIQKTLRAILKSFVDLSFIWQMRKQFTLAKRVFFTVFLFVVFVISGMTVYMIAGGLDVVSSEVKSRFEDAVLYKTASSTFASEGLELPYVWDLSDGNAVGEGYVLYIDTSTTTVAEDAFRSEYGNYGLVLSAAGIHLFDPSFSEMVPAADVRVAPDVNLFAEVQETLVALKTGRMAVVGFLIISALVALVLGVRYLFILLAISYLLQRVFRETCPISYTEYVTMGMFVMVPVMIVAAVLPVSSVFALAAFLLIMVLVIKKHTGKKT